MKISRRSYDFKKYFLINANLKKVAYLEVRDVIFSVVCFDIISFI